MSHEHPEVCASTEPPDALVTPLVTPLGTAHPNATVDGRVATGRPVAVGPKPRPLADAASYSMLEPLKGVRGLLRAMGHRAEEGHAGDAELAAMAELRDLLALAIDIIVLQQLDAGQSFGDVAQTLGITRQSVAARYKGMSRRRPGGQPAGTR